MRGKLFWLAVAFFAGVAAHTGFVLAVPDLTLGQSIAAMSRQVGANKFFILTAPDQNRFFPTYPALSVVGACAFDVSKGPVEFTADMPPGFWTLTVYSSKGDVIYALNDRQSGTGSFTLGLAQAPGFLEMLSLAAADDPREVTGWNVRTADPRGLAVLWQPVADEALRPAALGSIGKATCKSVNG